MSRRKGTVTAVGKGPYSYFLILDDDGFYFNTKFEPKVGVKDEVGIEFERKGDKRGNVKKIKLLADSGGKKGVTERAREGGGSGSAADPNRQPSIIWQHSQEIATRTVEILLSAKAFALEGSADAKRVQIEALLDELTTRFFKDAQDPVRSNAYKINSELEDDDHEEKESKSDDAWGDDEEEDDWDA